MSVWDEQFRGIVEENSMFQEILMGLQEKADRIDRLEEKWDFNGMRNWFVTYAPDTVLEPGERPWTLEKWIQGLFESNKEKSEKLEAIREILEVLANV